MHFIWIFFALHASKNDTYSHVNSHSCHGMVCVFQTPAKSPQKKTWKKEKEEAKGRRRRKKVTSRTEKKQKKRNNKRCRDNKTMRNEQVKIKRADASSFGNYNVQLSCE